MTSSGHEPAAKPPSYRRYRITAGEPTLEYRRLLDRVPEASEIT